MNVRKHLTLLVGGGICLVLVLVAVVALVRFRGGYARTAKDLKSATEKLDRLNRRDPFPDAGNVAVLETNRTVLSGYQNDLLGLLQAGQVAGEKIEPAEFASLIERLGRRLRDKAREAQIKLPDRFALGFARYAAGALPRQEDLPRLVVQARTIEVLSGVLIDSRVKEILDLQRSIFEVEPGAAGGDAGGVRDLRGAGTVEVGPRGNAPVSLPPVESNELYAAERYTLSFNASEHAAWEVLNALARIPQFAVVTHVEIQNTLAAAAAAPGAAHAAPPAAMREAAGVAGAAPGAAPIYPSHEERIAGGREDVRMDVVVDVYRFADQAKPEGGA